MLRSITRRICTSASAFKGSNGGQVSSHGAIAGLKYEVVGASLVFSKSHLASIQFRPISIYGRVLSEAKSEDAAPPVSPDEEPSEDANNNATSQSAKPEKVSEKDRTKVIPVETSIRYLQSAAFKETYQGNPVWVLYRRNFKGQFAPKRTRKTCIRHGMLTTGNPCPICRDEYLVLDYRNVELLKQFISPYNGEILSYTKTGLCQARHSQLLVAILKAKDQGLITYDVPFREYDYSEYEKIYESYKVQA